MKNISLHPQKVMNDIRGYCISMFRKYKHEGLDIAPYEFEDYIQETIFKYYNENWEQKINKELHQIKDLKNTQESYGRLLYGRVKYHRYSTYKDIINGDKKLTNIDKIIFSELDRTSKISNKKFMELLDKIKQNTNERIYNLILDYYGREINIKDLSRNTKIKIDTIKKTLQRTKHKLNS